MYNKLIKVTSNPEILIFGAILTCNIEEHNDMDMHYYKMHGRTEVVDSNVPAPASKPEPSQARPKKPGQAKPTVQALGGFRPGS